jgi:hypothetical protein
MPERQSPEIQPTNVASSQTARNPYILNFCRALVEKKAEKHEPEVMKKLLDDMYRLYESMLGHNMVNSLPETLRQEYLSLTQDLSKLDYEKIAEIFDKNIANHQDVMKETMKQFAVIFMKNRQFDPKDYPVPHEALPE